MSTKRVISGAIFFCAPFSLFAADAPANSTPAQTIRYSLPPRRGDIFILNSLENQPEPIASTNPVFEDFVKDVAYFAIDFMPVANSTERGVVSVFANKALKAINSQIDTLNIARAEKKIPLLKQETLTDNVIWGYFAARRWLPMRISSVLTAEEEASLRAKKFQSGVTLIQRTVRSYPDEQLASQLIGRFSPSSVTAWKRGGAIQENDYLFPRQKAGTIDGKNFGTGLERSLAPILDSGTPTVMEKSFDANGVATEPHVVKAGTDGSSVLLTLDYHLQKIAEEIVRDTYTKSTTGKSVKVESNGVGQPKGFVLIDLHDMSVAAMASSPAIDLRRLSPGFGVNDTYESDADKDKKEPFNSRAFENSYPPASTFKLVTAMAGLETGFINENSRFSCPASVTYLEGDGPHKKYRAYKNHVDEQKELHLDSVPMYTYADAIKRSCNTWFYQMANAMYEDNPAHLQKLFDIAAALGFGKAPNLPVPGLGKGFIYNDVNGLKDEHGNPRPFNPGDIANLAIGQGETEATALQVAWMTSQIAVPTNTKKLQLIRGVYEGPQRKYVDYAAFQGANGANAQEPRVVPLSNIVKVSNVKLIHQAMWRVANESWGTATRVNSNLDYHPQVAAKTGTGQWKKKYVAWLTGFFPHNAPRYAFAVFIEGRPNLTLSGGGSVAPLVNAFLSDPIVKAKIQEHLASGADQNVTGFYVPDNSPPTRATKDATLPTVPRAIPVRSESETRRATPPPKPPSAAAQPIPRALPADTRPAVKLKPFNDTPSVPQLPPNDDDAVAPTPPKREHHSLFPPRGDRQ